MSSDAQLGALTGAVLGGAYEVTRLLGEGGMGAVYEATQVRLNKRVAVKVMSRELASNSEALARFRREAEVTSRLGHPHLVTVMDFGTTDTGQPYLVMEYLDGEDLDHRIRRLGRLHLATAVAITRQVASALAAAHDEGIVHRDLKPGNVFLVKVKGEDDFVKVLDFGISKIKASRTKLTRASAVMGTPEYMSPEQATGLIEEIDHRADQWALACIGWEMLSGYAPFIADDMGALFYQVINMDPHPLSRRAPGLPPEVEPVLRRALSKRAAERFPSIQDFARAFEAAATGFARERTPPPIAVPRTAPGKGTVPYSNGPFAGKRPADRASKQEAFDRAPDLPAQLARGEAEDDFDLDESQIPRSFRRSYILVIAASVLLVAAALIFWPRKAQPPSANTTATPAPLPRSPEVTALPAPAPPPVIPAPPAESGAVHTVKPKSPKGAASDSLYKGGSGKSQSGAETERPSYANPFEQDRPDNKPVDRKPTNTRPQRQIIEDL